VVALDGDCVGVGELSNARYLSLNLELLKARKSPLLSFVFSFEAVPPEAAAAFMVFVFGCAGGCRTGIWDVGIVCHARRVESRTRLIECLPDVRILAEITTVSPSVTPPQGSASFMMWASVSKAGAVVGVSETIPTTRPRE
jgi:hypothetical protein